MPPSLSKLLSCLPSDPPAPDSGVDIEAGKTSAVSDTRMPIASENHEFAQRAAAVTSESGEISPTAEAKNSQLLTSDGSVKSMLPSCCAVQFIL